MKNYQIKNIIFDLGDVILNIDVPLASLSFAKLCEKSQAEVLQLFASNRVFQQLETGFLSDNDFRNLIREIVSQPDWSDKVIDTAWNSLLLDIPQERITQIQKLSQHYRLFLLSNTSSIHITQVNKILSETNGIDNLNTLFEKVFLSYEMGVMKPDLKIYQDVLHQAGILAEETLFLDDNLDNINAANQLGIHTIHVQKPTTILEYLKDYAV